jgi:hypothetical protein
MGLLGLLQMESFWAQWKLFAASNHPLEDVERKKGKIFFINIM